MPWSESQPCLQSTPVTLTKSLSQTEPRFPHQFHGCDCWSEMRENYVQCLTIISALGSRANGCRNRPLAWQEVRGAGTPPIHRTPGPVDFCQFVNSFPQRKGKQAWSKGSASLTKACCVSSGPSTHLVVLTDLKMSLSFLPCSHVRTW